jgi:hypothetical protein
MGHALYFKGAHRRASLSIGTMGHVDIDIYVMISMVLAEVVNVKAAMTERPECLDDSSRVWDC